jgi:hypothetical protein
MCASQIPENFSKKSRFARDREEGETLEIDATASA